MMESGGAVVVLGVYVSASGQQHGEDGVIAAPSSPVEWSLTEIIPRFQGSAGRQQCLGDGGIVVVIGGGFVERSVAAVV